ncbi:YhbP family protein [Cedecea sp. S5-13]|uniref:YhbP family protein n=1 Tax=Cedecea selenatireducens TaxID=3144416 RepID=UPI0035CD2EAC
MESLNAISRWLTKQHVLSYCVGSGESLWCANAFYIFDAERVAFYLLSETTSRHGELIGELAPVAGTINGQPKTVALIRGVQFRGEICLLAPEEAADYRRRYLKRFPIARVMSAPMWEIRLDELKMTDNTLGFGKKLHWLRED